MFTKAKNATRLTPDTVCVGMQVAKLSGNPFKSGEPLSHVVEITKHSITGRPAVRVTDGSEVALYVLYQYPELSEVKSECQK